MIKRIRAIFDGDVLRPAEPLDLAPNTEVQITLDIPSSGGEHDASFLELLRACGLKVQRTGQQMLTDISMARLTTRMDKFFLDTSFAIALSSRRDQHNKRATELARDIR